MKNKVEILGHYGSDEIIALKTKIPDSYWLDYIRINLYYNNGNVFSKNSDYKKPLGSKNSSNYICVCLEPKRSTPRKTLNIKLHHLVWFLNTGVWSNVEIDHIDRDKFNNLFENLRQSNRKEQCINRNNLSKRDYNERYIQYWKIGDVYRVVKNKKVLNSFKSKEEAIKFRDNYGL
jgi:hypothetical protein